MPAVVKPKSVNPSALPYAYLHTHPPTNAVVPYSTTVTISGYQCRYCFTDARTTLPRNQTNSRYKLYGECVLSSFISPCGLMGD
eukprot:211018-Rhodomonas_salina.3